MPKLFYTVYGNQVGYKVWFLHLKARVISVSGKGYLPHQNAFPK